MSVNTMLQKLNQANDSPVKREGKDTVIYISPTVITTVMLIVAALAGLASALNTAEMVHLTRFGSYLADTVFAIALWFPMNHRRQMRAQAKQQVQ